MFFCFFLNFFGKVKIIITSVTKQAWNHQPYILHTELYFFKKINTTVYMCLCVCVSTHKICIVIFFRQDSLPESGEGRTWLNLF